MDREEEVKGEAGRVRRDPEGALKPCSHPECDAYREQVGCIMVCPMCGRPYSDHPACTGCDSPGHQIKDCPLVKAYDAEGGL